MATSKITKRTRMRGTTYDVVLRGLTLGELYALRNALEMRSAFSPVASDVLGYFDEGCEAATLKELGR